MEAVLAAIAALQAITEANAASQGAQLTALQTTCDTIAGTTSGTDGKVDMLVSAVCANENMQYTSMESRIMTTILNSAVIREYYRMNDLCNHINFQIWLRESAVGKGSGVPYLSSDTENMQTGASNPGRLRRVRWVIGGQVPGGSIYDRWWGYEEDSDDPPAAEKSRAWITWNGQGWSNNIWAGIWWFDAWLNVIIRPEDDLVWTAVMMNVKENKNVDIFDSGSGATLHNAADLRKLFGFKSYVNGAPVEENDEWLTERMRILLPEWLRNVIV